MGISDPGDRGKLDAAIVREVIRSYSYVALWMSVSIAVILFNKWLLAYSGFPFPIALTLWHMMFCSAVGFTAVRLLKLVPSHNMKPREYLTRVAPIGALYAGSLWLSNSAYLHLSVSFIQMTKSLMPGLVYAAGVVLGNETWRRDLAGTMALIAAGVVVCAVGEVALVPLGLVQQLAALVFEAVRLALVQVLMNARGLAMNPLQSLYYVSPACLVSLLLPFGAVEWPRIAAASAAGQLNLNPPVMFANALAALALNLAVFLLIGKTSALTMNIAGVIKDWMLIFASYALFGAPVTRLNLAGYVFCCAGVVVYNRLKLVALTARLAGEGSSSGTTGGRDLEAPLLVQRSKADILADIGRLRAELDAADGGRRGTSSSTGSMHIGLSTPQRLTGLQSQGAQLMSRSGGSGSGGSSVGNSPSLAAGRHA